MKPRWQRTARRDVETVDITAFLGLMVILVPFLLVTAVFSRTTIIELQQGAAGETGTAPKDELQLSVTVRRDVIEVSHLGLEQPVRISRVADLDSLAPLSELVELIKREHPDSQDATVLVEPHIPFDLLVQILDILRVRVTRVGDTVEKQSLFPSIALGFAPMSGPAAGNAP